MLENVEKKNLLTTEDTEFHRGKTTEVFSVYSSV